LSTSATHIHLEPSWKLEVNQRVAAHKNRKNSPPAGHESASEAQPDPDSRAARAAARVAERYAKAPSYSEMLAKEARAAVVAAEAASRAAQHAHAAAQYVLAGLEAAVSAEPEPDQTPLLVEPSPDQALGAPSLHVVRSEWAEYQESEPPSVPAGLDTDPQAWFEAQPNHAPDQHFAIRWEPDLPIRRPDAVPPRASHADRFESSAQDWLEPSSSSNQEEIAMVEPAQPIYANLIQFPRELVATRKVRPRRAEGSFAPEAGSQLSIFEVDPCAISIEPEPTQPAGVIAEPAWNAPEWSGIKLDAQPQEQLLDEPEPQPQPAPALELASFNRRLLATVFDFTLISGAFIAAAIMAANNARELPGLREIELGSAVALVVVAALYQALFFTLARTTPGMKYARLSLCTFEGHIPTRAQRCGRLLALLLSVLPVGLGLVWAIFDENHLTWHDRLSRTYLRKF
jgi:uncharacterized RDD family membrane protein YckC